MKATAAVEMGMIRDAQEKYSACIVSYKKEWYYIAEIDQRWSAIAYKLADGMIGNGMPVKVPLTKTTMDELNYNEFPLGFATHGKSCYYISRAPIRKNKHGLREDNMVIYDVATGQVVPRMYMEFIRHKILLQPLENEYPTFLEACKTAAENGVGLTYPFHRDFAIRRTSLRSCLLLYRLKIVGEVDFATGLVELYPSYHYMYERLAQRLGSNFTKVLKAQIG